MATRAKLFSQLAKSVDTSGTITSAGISSTVSLGATVYDSAGQLPTSGYNAGDQAFVISTSRLYINSGVGWYNVAVINNTPIVQSVLDSDGGTTPFALAIDGTPTTITITAVDSDGDPLTYSSTADSDFGGLATISQADNVFTITPFSQDSATTSSGTITFSITDGINIANSGIQTFTLNFLSSYWDETVLSIGTSSTNSLANSTFIDRSANAHTVTTSGSPVQTAFHPYLDNWSIDTNNSGTSGGHLRASYETPLGTSDFSIEAWVYYVSGSAGWTGNRNDTSGGFASRLGSTSISLGLSIGGTYNAVLTSSSYPDITNKWTHIAICRSSGTTSIYVDGNRYATTSTEINWNLTNQWTVGYEYDNYTISDLVMHISNYRLVNGSSAYDATQTSITVPTEKLTAITNTQILTCQDNRFVDNSGNNVTFDIIHAPIVSAFNPFGQLSEYAVGQNKGSAYIPENSYINIAHDASQALGGNNFTIEWWMNLQAAVPNDDVLLDKGWGGSSYGELLIYSKGANYLAYMSSTGSTWNILSQFNTGIEQKLNEWQHCAIVRNGSQVAFFVNGKLTAGSTTIGSSSLVDTGDPITICSSNGGVKNHPATYISDFKWTVGTAAYDATSASVGDQVFTPPTAPLTNSGANTVLYLPMDNAGIYDKTGNSTITLAGNVATSTVQSKFASTSMYFDGTGDYAEFSLPAIGTGDFTFEGWVYFSTIQASYIFDCREVASGTTHPALDIQNDWRYIADNSYVITSGVTPSANQWYHFAVVRSSGTTTLYIDGTSIGSVADSRSYLANPTATIGMFRDKSGGGPLHGYLENFQILIGTAKYTTNFTPPTQTQGRTYQAES